MTNKLYMFLEEISDWVDDVDNSEFHLRCYLD